MPARIASNTGTETTASLKGRSRSIIAESSAQHWVEWFAEQSGLGWECLDVTTGEIVARSHVRTVPFCSVQLRRQLPQGAHVVFHCEDHDLVEVALPLPGLLSNGLALTSYFLTNPQARPIVLAQAAAQDGWTNSEFDAFLANAPTMSFAIGKRLIEGLLHRLNLESRGATLEYEIGALSQQLEYASDEVTMLHGVSEHLNLARSVRELAEHCLHRMHGLIDAAGHLVVIEDDDHVQHVLTAGKVPFDDHSVQRLLHTLNMQGGVRAIVRNELAGVLLGEDYPGLESLLAASIGDRNGRYGWIVSCNLRYGLYGLVESNLLTTVARMLSTHSQNQRLFHEQDELLIDFVRSLVSTLDAKDPYTRGHSERVALIARRLSEQLGHSEDLQNAIYLSSLLHDIGKVGVDDRILRKPDQLTPEEFEQVQRHPDIGYEILKPLKHLQHILPGVRSHHEAMNGRGYPQGLKGDAIPLMARIIAVADSYDAMSSDRPYRRGMPLERVEEIFRRGAGEQWDRRIVDAYFAARDEIRALCEGYTLQDGNLLDNALYGTWSGIGNRFGNPGHHRSAGDPRFASSSEDLASRASLSSVFSTAVNHQPQTT